MTDTIDTQVAALTERIEELDDAIRAAVTGSSYSIGGRSITRQDLSELRAERTRLVRERKQALAVLAGAVNPGTAVASWYR